MALELGFMFQCVMLTKNSLGKRRTRSLYLSNWLLLSQQVRWPFKTLSIFVYLIDEFDTGTTGALIANPVDVIKIRMMVNTGRYTSLVNGFTSIIKDEGAGALYNGLVPSTLRGVIAYNNAATVYFSYPSYYVCT